MQVTVKAKDEEITSPVLAGYMRCKPNEIPALLVEEARDGEADNLFYNLAPNGDAFWFYTHQSFINRLLSATEGAEFRWRNMRYRRLTQEEMASLVARPYQRRGMRAGNMVLVTD